MKPLSILLITLLLVTFRKSTTAQSPQKGRPTVGVANTATTYTLEDCIRTALQNQPAIHRAAIDESIAKTNKAIALSYWMPQVNIAANYQHYLELPTSFLRVNDVLTPVKTGVANTSNPELTAIQNIFSNDVLVGTKTANLYISIAREQAKTTQMDIATLVTKSYYDVLLGLEKIKVFREDTQRLRKNQQDAYHRFVSGIADKVDYKQASISLNNSLTQLHNAVGSIDAAYAALRYHMGMAAEAKFSVSYDTARALREVEADTVYTLQIERRPEYKQLMLVRRIQEETSKYYRRGYIPNLSAYYTYNYQFQSNDFGNLYKQAYPNSFAGLQMSLPLFTGMRRIENSQKSRLLEERADWDIVNLKLGIYAEYAGALAAYKNNKNSYHAQAENLAMAREVYNVVKLQYNEGVKAYLDVIVAETDLQTSEINFQYALFELLKSKATLERALGITQINF